MGNMNRLQRRDMFKALADVERRLRACGQMVSDCYSVLQDCMHSLVLQEQIDREFGGQTHDDDDENPA